ncbi:alpha/beta fold hydrolase [Aureimonas sp. ME7]|uniref:alpha/beta hydrolase n=1 Tax=Aureimonas sp. ME7 TaxID=2744252 RepID=UPI001FCEA619|nr:alpha/beta fold hydrolase [Aureimonas sp. ME7]
MAAVLIGILLIVGAFVWVFGPREPARLSSDVSETTIGTDPVAYLQRTEEAVANLRPGTEKEIVWAYPASRAKTPLAIVYIHGFTASKGETRPLADEVAQKLGANLFFTRLAGHGGDGAAMADATVGDWIDDYAEALAVGRLIGERVVVIGTSTGATLATVGASRAELSRDLAALVEISPNFGVADWRSFLLTLPFARETVPYLGPETFSSDRADMTVDETWTRSYPTLALLPMARLVEIAAHLDVSQLRLPALFVYSRGDRVVNPAKTEAISARWGGAHDTIIVDDSTDPSQHLIAGDAVSPNTTDRLAEEIAEWIRRSVPN